MKPNLLRIMIMAISAITVLSACQESQPLPEQETPLPETTATVAEPTIVSIEPTVDLIEPTTLPTIESEPATDPLPERAGPRVQTTGSVPHVQIDVNPVPAVNDALFQRAFAIPGVEDRPTVVSLPGAIGMWLNEELELIHPEAIVSGREFAHIHPDGSLHAPLPFERALEVAEKGWGERHPWADERDGWDGFVMLFTPQSMEELDIIMQLIVESYNYVTGLNLQASDF